MSHANAPLTPAGRLRLVRRCEHRPIAHVAAEAGVSRQCLSKWKARYVRLGEAGLLDRSSVPHCSPAQLDPDVVAQIEAAAGGVPVRALPESPQARSLAQTGSTAS